jgi:hypothetical protein
MKKVIRLTETELTNLIKRVIKENSEPEEKSGMNFKVGDKLKVYFTISGGSHQYGQVFSVQVKGVRGGFGPGVQGPASQKNSIELDCVMVDATNTHYTIPKLKNGDAVTLVINNANSPMTANWSLLKGGKPVLDDNGKNRVGGRLSDTDLSSIEKM